jgi:hemoglobin-like flavoprotein
MTLSEFYAQLFGAHPEYRDLFVNGFDFDRMNNALISALDLATSDFDALVNVLGTLGERHTAAGVTSEHYDAAGVALLTALSWAEGTNWNPALEDAWKAAYEAITGAMVPSQG